MRFIGGMGIRYNIGRNGKTVSINQGGLPCHLKNNELWWGFYYKESWKDKGVEKMTSFNSREIAEQIAEDLVGI